MTDPLLMEAMLRNAVAWLHKEVMSEEGREPGSSWRLHLVDVITAMRTADVLERIAVHLEHISNELELGNVKLTRVYSELENINSTLVAAQNDSPVQVEIRDGLDHIEGAILALDSTIQDK